MHHIHKRKNTNTHSCTWSPSPVTTSNTHKGLNSSVNFSWLCLIWRFQNTHIKGMSSECGGSPKNFSLYTLRLFRFRCPQTQASQNYSVWFGVILWPACSLHPCWLTVWLLSVDTVADNNTSSKEESCSDLNDLHIPIVYCCLIRSQKNNILTDTTTTQNGRITLY